MPDIIQDLECTDSNGNSDSDYESELSDSEELPLSDRIELAFHAWKANPKLSIRKAHRQFGVSYTTLYGRIKGAKPRKEASQARQRLSVGEEEALQDWIIQLSNWGWPCQIFQLRAMAIGLLHQKSDMEELGLHWVQGFLKRHPTLKSRFVTGLDKERALAEDATVFQN